MAGPKPLKVAPTEHHPRICLDDNARSKFMHSVLKLKDTLIGTRRRRRVTILILVILLPLALLNPIGTVRGLVVNIGRSANGGFTMDAGRIAFVDSTTFRIVVYNLASRSAINLPLLPVGSPGGTPSIQGNKLVIPSTTGLLMPETIYYCVLTTSSCGPWIVIAAGAPSLFFFSQHGFPLVSGDIVVWPVAGGFNYYRFSSAGTAFVATPTQAFTPSTDGETIALAAKPTPASPSMTLMYYETSPPAASAVDTALPTIPVISIAQDIMAFNDNSTVPTCVVGTGGTSCDYRIRYYDFLRSLPSPAGAGPVGTLGTAQSVWADRIVFAITESSLNFDCNSNGGFFSGDAVSGTLPDLCVVYWNIRARAFISILTAPEAAPSGSTPEIYEGIVVFNFQFFSAPTSTFLYSLEYVTVPMRGDINQDGKVDVSDMVTTGICLGSMLKGSFC